MNTLQMFGLGLGLAAIAYGLLAITRALQEITAAVNRMADQLKDQRAPV
jgi:hypothetical protein